MKTQQSTIKSGERLSFLQLFTAKQLTIEIPIIQRDYAQGRKSKREVRIKFVDALYNYLNQNIPFRNLDFIYGSISKVEDNLLFIPLDGQQRLTTLFLLHWYLAVLGNRKDELKSYIASKNRSLFTYETRASAREFCDALMLENIEYSIPDSDNKISDIIQNQGWYYLSWKYDPTIQAMLIMLDEIENKFHNNPEFLDRLIDPESPIITFLFLDLKEFQLSDDLYIKMNSRGKELTPFENFKAKLEQQIEVLFKNEIETFELCRNNKTLNVTAHKYFSNMIDTNWLNHFWKTGGQNPKLVDRQMMNFIRVVLANNYAISSHKPKGENLRILFETQDAKINRDVLDKISFFEYQELGAISKDAISLLIHSFDQLLQLFAFSNDSLPDSFHYPHKQIFNNVIEHDLSAQERLRFHACSQYLIMYPEKSQGLKEWMRVVYNLTENTRIEDADAIAKGLQEIESLLPEASDILSFLASDKNNIGFFYSRQIEEERIKACLLLKEGKWPELIWNIEKHPFFKGQIGFLLEFSGILNYYYVAGNCRWSQKEDIHFNTQFTGYSEKASIVFTKLLQSDEKKDCLWARTVLTKGDYLISAPSWRYNFLTVSPIDRDYSWKRLLRLNKEGEDDDMTLKKGRLYVKDVLDDKRFNADNFEQSCRQIIKDVPEDWRLFFIQNPELIKACKKGFIRFDDELTIKLLTTTRLTFHYELRTYNLYLKRIQEMSFNPFVGTKYFTEYGVDGWSHIYIGHWLFDRKGYRLRIYFDKENYFSIEFSKMKGKNQEQDYSEHLLDIFSEMKFKFDLNDWNGFYKTAKTENAILKILNQLCKNLNQIAQRTKTSTKTIL